MCFGLLESAFSGCAACGVLLFFVCIWIWAVWNHVVCICMYICLFPCSMLQMAIALRIAPYIQTENNKCMFACNDAQQLKLLYTHAPTKTQSVIKWFNIVIWTISDSQGRTGRPKLYTMLLYWSKVRDLYIFSITYARYAHFGAQVKQRSVRQTERMNHFTYISMCLYTFCVILVNSLERRAYTTASIMLKQWLTLTRTHLHHLAIESYNSKPIPPLLSSPNISLSLSQNHDITHFHKERFNRIPLQISQPKCIHAPSTYRHQVPDFTRRI